MDLQIISEFVKLVETGNFMATAEEMNISISALSKHIHKLEEEVGVPLLDRSKHGVRMNGYSQRFYPFAVQALNAYSDGIATIREMNDREKGTFTVAYDPVFGQYGLPEVLTGFSDLYRCYKVNIIESYQALELLNSKKSTFAFVGETEAEGADCCKLLFKTDRLAAVFPGKHPLAGRDSVTMDEIAGEGMILHSSSGPRAHDETKKFLELCEEANITPKIEAESLFTSTMLHYVKNGKGIAILNRMHIPFGMNDFSVVKISPEVTTELFLLYPRRLVSPCAKDFLHYMIDHCEVQD